MHHSKIPLYKTLWTSRILGLRLRLWRGLALGFRIETYNNDDLAIHVGRWYLDIIREG